MTRRPIFPSQASAPVRLALRKEEAAAALGISDESFTRYCVPRLRVVRFGTLKLYPVAELSRMLEDEAAAIFDESDRSAA